MNGISHILVQVIRASWISLKVRLASITVLIDLLNGNPAAIVNTPSMIMIRRMKQ